MKLLENKSWRGVYRSDEHNIFTEFYAPALECAVRYDRAVGFFGAQALVANLAGISGLVRNNGRMRLVIGHPLEDDEFDAVKSGYRIRGLIEQFDNNIDQIIRNISSLGQKRLALLSYLISQNRLEIKYAVRRRGMYHEKIGVITDESGGQLIFTGSPNETVYGLSGEFNAESISVYKSWDEGAYSTYGKDYVEGFEKLWHGNKPSTVTIDVPSETYEKIRSIPKPKLIEEIDESQDYDEIRERFFSGRKKFNVPTVPKKIGNQEFKIRPHQTRAMTKWQQNHFKGILQLSTGSGKTITSIYAATKLYQARSSKNRKTVLIVSVPYQELAEQWVRNLNIFNIHPLKCWHSRNSWFDDLQQEFLDFRLNVIDFISIVVVNRTLESEHFQSLISVLSPEDLFFIGDECHNHGSAKTSSALPDAFYRMGLSATPYRSDEDEIDSPFPNTAKINIDNYYGGIVAEYSLGDAIDDGVLCEYEYHILPVYLSDDEQEQYEALTLEIGKLIQYASNGSNRNKNELTKLCGQRSRLLGGAKNKLSVLENLVESIPREERKYSLFYCGEGKTISNESIDGTTADEKIIEQVSSCLNEKGWQTSRFTSAESKAERAAIMSNFANGVIDALVSMKVLDEGVDVPVCDKAFILASTRNPRQYIQRRGRVLRQHEGKERAKIFDFVVLPLSETSASRRLKAAELERIDDFAVLALNRYEVEKNVQMLGLREEI